MNQTSEFVSKLKYTSKRIYHGYELQINRIYHRSLMQTKKSQPEGKLIMPETRFTLFLALSVDLTIGVCWSAWETDV